MADMFTQNTGFRIDVREHAFMEPGKGILYLSPEDYKKFTEQQKLKAEKCLICKDPLPSCVCD